MQPGSETAISSDVQATAVIQQQVSIRGRSIQSARLVLDRPRSERAFRIWSGSSPRIINVDSLIFDGAAFDANCENRRKRWTVGRQVQ